MFIIPEKTFATKQINQVKLDSTRKFGIWIIIILCNFWPILPKFCCWKGDWVKAKVSSSTSLVTNQLWTKTLWSSKILTQELKVGGEIENKVNYKKINASNVYRDFLGIPSSAGDFWAGAQKDIIVNFEE